MNAGEIANQDFGTDVSNTHHRLITLVDDEQALLEPFLRFDRLLCSYELISLDI
jgi:hypothetical protein